MSAKRKKTLLRTFRLTRELYELLQNDAEQRRMNLNALVSMILTKYAEWDRYSEKFGFVTIPRELLKSGIEYTEEEKVTKLAEEMGARLPKEFILFRFKKMNIETFLALLSLQSRYGKVFEHEVETDERNYTITIHHDLGEKWSKFLSSYLGQAMKTALGMVPKVEVSKSSVVMRFFIP